MTDVETAAALAESGKLPEFIRGQTGRAYLRGAVTLAEHAAVVLVGLPAEELEPVRGMVGRIEAATTAIRAGGASVSATAPVPAAATTSGGLW